MLELLLVNWPTILELGLALHGLALIVVNLTPTPKDDRVLGKIYKVLEWLSGIVTNTAKALPGESGKDIKLWKDANAVADAITKATK